MFLPTEAVYRPCVCKEACVCICSPTPVHGRTHTETHTHSPLYLYSRNEGMGAALGPWGHCLPHE